MKKNLLKTFAAIVVMLFLWVFFRPFRQKQFEFDENLSPTLSQGSGITKEHALHFYEVFLNILLNKHNKFAEHAENVYLLNYLIRNDVKWRVTENAIFDLFDITDNQFISKQEFESFADLFTDQGHRIMVDAFRMLIDRDIDTRIQRSEWINFCNKILRPKLIQDLQEWEKNHSPLPNPQNITAQYSAPTKEERNRKDLIHLQLTKCLQLFHDGFKTFVQHFESGEAHSKDDPDLFVRRIGMWILSRFERWDAVFNWIYQLLDDNGEGRLTPKECANQFTVFGVATIHVREIFEYFDDNGDGIVTRVEWEELSETIRRLLFNHFNVI